MLKHVDNGIELSGFSCMTMGKFLDLLGFKRKLNEVMEVRHLEQYPA